MESHHQTVIYTSSDSEFQILLIELNRRRQKCLQPWEEIRPIRSSSPPNDLLSAPAASPILIVQASEYIQ